jgi:hypothetical protein
VVRIADEHGGGIRARMAVDSGESHLTEHDRSAYRPADYSITISISKISISIASDNLRFVVKLCFVLDSSNAKVIRYFGNESCIIPGHIHIIYSGCLSFCNSL